MVDISYIPRKLRWADKDFEPHTIDDTKILKFHQPVVILGDPGMGKTWLMERLGKQDECEFIRATSFLRQPDQQITNGKRLVIDGLDEVAAVEEGNPLHNILIKLIACGKPPFVISCRSAEWQSATGKIDIVDEYGQSPMELQLEPLSRDDAIASLSNRVSPELAEHAIKVIDNADLSSFYTNPLPLNFIAAIVKAEGTTPDTRAKLYKLAVEQLRLEPNERHQGSPLASLSEDSAFDAAGAAMATMLITGNDRISLKNEDKATLSLTEVTDLVNHTHLKAVLGSNLFRADPTCQGQFLPLHRTVAEFLGARWLAGQVDRSSHPSRMAMRLLGLISAEGGVPASLRGLHAWLPKFSPTRLGPNAIDRDPYGVLRYGDGDELSLDQARQIIERLQKLEVFDPYFRTDWGNSLSVKGLAQVSLHDEIRSLIIDDQVPYSLRSLLLRSLLGTELANTLVSNLEAIVFNPKYTFHERNLSAEILNNTKNSTQNWPLLVENLTALGDEDSKRLATELLEDVGYDKFNDVLIARTVIAYSNILEPEQGKERIRSLGIFFSLARSLPIDRLTNLLDELTAIVLPTRNPEKWWSDSYHEGWSEFARLVDSLVLRQLEHDKNAVSPQQLWDWMRTLERERDHHRDERKAIAEIFKSDARLRRGVQRLALFESGTKRNIHSLSYRLTRHSSGLQITDEDARLYIKELTEKERMEDREVWMALVGQFRTEGIIPKDIQEIARPFAGDDGELVNFLTKKSKRHEYEEWEIKHRRKEGAQGRKRQKQIEEARKNFGVKVAEIKKGEFQWILAPARAYLGLFSDLDREAPPADRITEWLGEELKDAALIGLEAVLYRTDLPTVNEISESYAESKVWNFIYPMLAGAGQRLLKGIGFADLPPSLISAISIAAENEHFEQREGFKGLKEALDLQLRSDPDTYEAHTRQKFEPMLKASRTHIPGLYGFAREDLERPLSQRLSLEWLKRYPDLPLETQRELAGCLLNAPSDDQAESWSALVNVAAEKLKSGNLNDESEKFWRGFHFLFDFNPAVKEIPMITDETRDWLWPLTSHIYSRDSEEERLLAVSIKQLKWIVEQFRGVWPHSTRPYRVTSGVTNSWDATELLERLINQIAKTPSNEAASALEALRDIPDDVYTITVQAALAAQHRVQLEANFPTPTLAELKAILSEASPQSAADVQAIVLDELFKLQNRLRGDPLNIVNDFYDDAGKPRTENACRDQLLIALGSLPFGISTSPEVAMPQGKRSDAAFVYTKIAVPFEVKGQWHKEVWTASATQLDRFYSVDY